MRKYLFTAAAFLTGLGLAVGWRAAAQQVARPVEETPIQRIARVTKLSAADVDRVLAALSDTVRDQLQSGKEFTLPGLGTFRVVQVAEHKDLRDGRPVVVPATNTVEFLAEEAVIDVANSPTAKPAEVVPEFRYIPLPNQTPGLRTGSTRAPNMRTK